MLVLVLDVQHGECACVSLFVNASVPEADRALLSNHSLSIVAVSAAVCRLLVVVVLFCCWRCCCRCCCSRAPASKADFGLGLRVALVSAWKREAIT